MYEVLRKDVLHRFDQVRRAMARRFDAFDAATALQVGVTPEWCMRDLAAHMAGWLRDFLDHADSLAASRPASGGVDTEAMNARFVREAASRSWEEVRRDWDAALDCTRAHLAAVPAAALEFDHPYRTSLESESTLHLWQHAGQVSGWMKELGLRLPQTPPVAEGP